MAEITLGLWVDSGTTYVTHDLKVNSSDVLTHSTPRCKTEVLKSAFCPKCRRHLHLLDPVRRKEEGSIPKKLLDGDKTRFVGLPRRSQSAAEKNSALLHILTDATYIGLWTSSLVRYCKEKGGRLHSKEAAEWGFCRKDNICWTARAFPVSSGEKQVCLLTKTLFSIFFPLLLILDFEHWVFIMTRLFFTDVGLWTLQPLLCLTEEVGVELFQSNW